LIEELGKAAKPWTLRLAIKSVIILYGGRELTNMQQVYQDF